MQCLFLTSKSQFLGKASSIFFLHEMNYTIPPGYKPEWGDWQTLVTIRHQPNPSKG